VLYKAKLKEQIWLLRSL